MTADHRVSIQASLLAQAARDRGIEASAQAVVGLSHQVAGLLDLTEAERLDMIREYMLRLGAEAREARR